MFGFVDSVGGLSSEDDLRSNVLLPDPSKDTILRIRDILTSISVLQKHNVAHQLLADVSLANFSSSTPRSQSFFHFFAGC